ncbi:MAG: hypothetical protein V1702_03950 [Candidatus Woesearchaeota archaeon]
MKPIILFALALLILASAAFADDNTTTRNNLEARYTHLACRAELVKAQSDILSKLVNSTPAADTINSNIEKLKEYADAGDVKGFNTYARTTLTTSFKTFGSRLITAKNEWRTLNQSRRERREGIVQAIADWKAATDAFSDCNNNAQRNIVTVRQQQITKAIENWNQVVTDMKAKGLNTTAEEAIIAEAEQLRAMLQEAQQITDDAAFQAKVEEIRQLHLHLWARFHIAKIESYLQQIEPKAIEAGKTEPVRQIKSLLDSSKAMAAKGNKYAEGEFEQTWQNIYQAGQKLKELAKSLRGDSQ